MANHCLGFVFLALFIGVAFGGAKQYTVSSEFYKFLKEARAGGVNVQPRITGHSDGTYSISIKTSKGTSELKKINKSSVDIFTELFTNPNLIISVVSQSGKEVTISVTESSGTSAYTYSSSQFGGGAKEFTVTSEFYSFLTEARAGGENVKPKITSNSDGTYTVSITTSKGTRELKNIKKNSVDLFAQLFTNPNLKISVVSKSGSNVKISVVEESAGSAYTYSPNFSSGGGAKEFTVTSEFYSFVTEARGGGDKVTPKITNNSDGTYTISITTSKGTRELKNIKKNDVDLFAQLFTNPNLKISVVSKSGSNVKISVVEESSSTSYSYTSTSTYVGSGTVSRDGSQEVKSYTVTIEFYDFITEARSGTVYGKPVITTNTDGTYTITITTSKGKRVLKNIRKELVDFFVQLYTNPSLKISFDSKSGPNVKISVSEESDGSSPVQLNSETIQLIKDFQTNPDLQLTHVSEKNGVYTMTFLDKGKTRTITGIPSKVAEIIIYKSKHPSSKVNLSPSGKASIPITSPAVRRIYTIGPKFLEAYNFLKKNPTSQVNVKQEPDNTYTLTITLDGKPQTYKNVDISLAQLLIFLFKNPKVDFKVTPQPDGKYKIVLPKNADNAPTTSAIPINFIPALEKILDNPNVTVEIEEPKTAEFQLVVNDGEEKKTYKVPKTLIPVVEKLLKTPKRKDGKPSYNLLSKNGKNHHISLNTAPETTTRPVDENFVSFIKQLEKKPDLAKQITYNIQPTGDKRYDITVNLGHRKYVFKKLPHNFVQFFINFVNNPKNTPHTITKHDTPEPKHHLTKDLPHKPGKPHLTKDLPHKPGKPHLTKDLPHKPGKPHLTKDVPHKPRHTLTVNQPAGNEEVPLKVKPATKHEISTTKFPSTHKIKPERKRPTGNKPVRDPNQQVVKRVYHPKETKPTTLDLLNTVKNSPHLKISVKPTKPGYYEIAVDDGFHKTTYPDVPVTTLTTLIKVRSNKNLPFEILPSQKPGHVNVKVPDENSPDTKRFPVSADILEVTDSIRNDPKSELEITPDKNGRFTVLTRRKGKEHKLKDLPSDAVETLVRLKSDDTLAFNIKPGKNGKLDLIIPKHHPKPVKTKLTPNILELIGRLKKNPYATFTLLPGKKPHTFTILLKDGAKTKTYPDVTYELIPILSQMYLTPTVDFEIKPTKDGSIQFLPSHSKPGDLYFDIPNRVFDIISSIKSKPWSTIKIEPTKRDYSVIVTHLSRHNTHRNIKPNDVRLIVYLVANNKLPFSVKPNEYGVTLVVPKADGNTRFVDLTPGGLNEKIIRLTRNKKHPSVTFKRNKNKRTLFDVNVGGNGGDFTLVPPSVLELVMSLVTHPGSNFKIEPQANGGMAALVPEFRSQTTHVKITSDKVQLINDLRRKPVNRITLRRDKQGYFDIDFDTPEGKKTLKHIKPRASQFLVDVVTNPRLPFYIYSDSGDYKLVVPKRPSAPKFTHLPKNVLEFVIKQVKNPHLTLDITPDHKKPGQFDVDFSIDGKKIQHFPNLNQRTIEFVNVLFAHPGVKLETEKDSDGTEVVVLRRLNLPTVDYTISPNVVKFLHHLTKPTVNFASAKHGKPGTFDLTLGYTGGAKKTFPGIKTLFFEPIFLILTKRLHHVHSYLDGAGKFRLSVPKRSVTLNNFKVQPDFYSFLTKIQTELPSLSFTLTRAGNSFDLVLATKSHKQTFKNFSPSAIEFFIQYLTHPKRKTEVKTVVRGGKSEVEVNVLRRTLKKGAHDVVFNNVTSVFIQLINDLRRKTGNSITIQRKGDLTLLLGYGKKGVQFDHFEPAILIELLVSILADPNFRYTAKLGPAGTYTFIAHDLKRNLEFHSLNAAVKAKGSQLTGSSDASLVLTRDAKHRLVLSTSINRGGAQELKDIDIETVMYLALSTVYKNLHFDEKKSATGQITTYLRLPAVERSYDITRFKANPKTVWDISRSLGGRFATTYTWLSRLVKEVSSNVLHRKGSGAKEVSSNVLQRIRSGAKEVSSNVLQRIGSGVSEVSSNVIGRIGSGVNYFIGRKHKSVKKVVSLTFNSIYFYILVLSPVDVWCFT